jgi:hypothetical protein
MKRSEEDAVRKKQAKAVWRWAALLALLGALVGIQAVSLNAGVCEDAIWECFNDVFVQAMGYLGSIYCFAGYAFCKRYIDPAA